MSCHAPSVARSSKAMAEALLEHRHQTEAAPSSIDRVELDDVRLEDLSRRGDGRDGNDIAARDPDAIEERCWHCGKR